MNEEDEMLDWILNNTDCYEYNGWVKVEDGWSFSTADMLEFACGRGGRIGDFVEDCSRGRDSDLWIE